MILRVLVLLLFATLIWTPIGVAILLRQQPWVTDPASLWELA
jgi:ABC-type anion transport system duplicated permease subunit